MSFPSPLPSPAPTQQALYHPLVRLLKHRSPPFCLDPAGARSLGVGPERSVPDSPSGLSLVSLLRAPTQAAARGTPPSTTCARAPCCAGLAGSPQTRRLPAREPRWADPSPLAPPPPRRRRRRLPLSTLAPSPPLPNAPNSADAAAEREEGPRAASACTRATEPARGQARHCAHSRGDGCAPARRHAVAPPLGCGLRARAPGRAPSGPPPGPAGTQSFRGGCPRLPRPRGGRNTRNEKLGAGRGF